MGEFEEVIRSLADLAGEEIVDFRDEHHRWHLYQRVINSERADLRDVLYQVIGWEEDDALALTVVLHVLEQVPEVERHAWVDRLRTSESHQYASARSFDIGMLESILQGAVSENALQALQERSDWLQLRLARRSESADVLDELANSGRTKRIKRLAAERLDKLELESILQGAVSENALQALQERSDWLQLRLARRSESADVLDELANSGRTKRIKRLAAERLAKLES
ncbi:hypothetical protein [Acrocarpospora sp. B8E8]|uniref:hypothetical protein n=1 Tax=Acrocarpospora sp. B8E8 TaxID=3153572 RepID=UPI00325C8AA9